MFEERKNRIAGAVTLLLSSLVLFNGCGGGASIGGAATSTNSSAPTLTSLSVSPASTTVLVKSSQQFSANGTFSDGSKKDMTGAVSWSIAHAGTATINNTGMAIAKQTGITTVVATLHSISGSATLIVAAEPLVSIAVIAPSASLIKGSRQQLRAIGTYGDGGTQDLTTIANWTSSATNVAAVSASGIAAAQSPGNATIAASSGSITGSTSLAVLPAPLVAISVTPNSVSLAEGNTQQLRAIGTYSDGTTQDLTTVVAWASSASAIAAVSNTGLTTAQAPGSANVVATSGAISGAAALSVTSPVLVSIAVNPASSSVFLGGSEQLSALGTFSDGSIQDITATAAWQTSNAAAVGINQTGIAAGQSIGAATVSATSNSVSGSAAVNVVPLSASDYFSNANTPGAPDATLTVLNTGITGGNLCAMVYVFDTSQELSECCGCTISADGERKFSVNSDLTANPLTGVQLHTGVIRIISSDPTNNPTCNAGTATPAGLLTSWVTHIQADPVTAYDVTEERSQLSPLSSSESTVLQTLCGYAQTLGSGHGVCSCGVGD